MKRPKYFGASYTRLEMECPKGHRCEIIFTAFKWRCARCILCGRSCCETAIRDKLDRMGLHHLTNYSTDKCRDKKALRFDFAVFNFKILKLRYFIEYDGRHHFRRISLYGGWNKLLDTQKKDKIKDDYCENKKINLIRIPYWNKAFIDEILDKRIDLKLF